MTKAAVPAVRTFYDESGLDKAIEILLMALVVFMPFALGVVHAWSEQVVIILSFSAGALFLLKTIIDKNTVIRFSWIYIPIAVFVLAAVIQLIPFPASLVSFISPNTAAINKELLSDLPDSSERLGSLTLSFYPNATEHGLRIVISLAIVFFVVFNHFRSAERIKRLLTAIAFTGGAVAVLALAQDLFGNGRIYWLIPAYDKAFSGTFINHSHYSQFMNLSIGAALALVFIRFHESFTGRKISPVDVFQHIGSVQFRPVWFLIGIIVIGVATIFISLSRGGIISLLIAGAFTTLSLTSRRSLKGRGWIMALMALGAFICVLYIGFDAVYERLATLRDINETQGGRWQIVKDISVAWTRFPILGTGLGTHEVVYPMFDRSTISALASHAENEYAQTAEETGIIGLTSLVIFAVFVWRAYFRNIRYAQVPVCSAAYGLGFGLLAVMIHSLSDFGQHLPANAGLSVIFCSMLSLLARFPDDQVSFERALPSKNHGLRTAGSFLLVFLTFAGAWAVYGANRARIAESYWHKAQLAENAMTEKNWQADDEDYADLIGNAASASLYEQGSVKYRHWLNVYRWYSISRVRDPNTGQVVIPEPAMIFVRRIVSELHEARALCPVYGATYCVVGQMEKYMLDNPSGAELIRKGYTLAPCDPTACFVAGMLDAEENRIDDSFARLSRAVELDGRLFRDAANVFITDLERPDLAVKMASDDMGRLSYVADSLAASAQHSELAEGVRRQIAALLESKCNQPDAAAGTFASLANIYRSEDKVDSAIECYRKALDLDYSQVRWRLTLAKLLEKSGNITEAVHEARICLRIQPQFEQAKKMIADLSVRPGAATEEDKKTP